MKITSIFILCVFLIQSAPFAQEHSGKWGRHEGRLKELEQVKLIETLDLDEETTLRFFSRRNEYLDQQKEIIKQREEVITNIENKLNEGADTEYLEMVDEVVNFEMKMLNLRKSFLNSLTEIFTQEEIAKFLVFQVKFKREVRNAFLRKGRDRMKRYPD